MKETENKIWNATLYLGLSSEDGDKEESNSITGQRELLRNYIAQRPKFWEYAVRIDDGFSGSTFERPSFQKMIEDVKAGRTDCIIVKDLSRFGRNYLDAGEYIEKIFPFLGVRFIAINDNYDSLGDKKSSDNLIIPFKNLINEAYCRDISVKLRSQFEIKRKNGQFIGSFAAYGYLKDEQNKNRLVVDEYAADIVRDIALEEIVPKSLQQHISEVVDMHSLLEITDTAALRTAQAQKVQRQLHKKREECEKLQKLLLSLYENLADGIIDRDEYARLKENFSARADEAEKQMDALRETLDEMQNRGEESVWMQEFIKHQGITALDRAVVVALFDKILIYPNNAVEITYRWQDEFSWQLDILWRARVREVL